jgi:transposase
MGGFFGERAVEGIMILLPRAVRVYFAIQPVNLRRSFDGLSNEVRSVLRHDPLTGHVFVFLNRRKTQVKLLIWTRGGFTIVHKRLERGTFCFPGRVTAEATSVMIDVHELGMLLEGIDVQGAHASKRWEPPAHARVDVVTMRDPM